MRTAATVRAQPTAPSADTIVRPTGSITAVNAEEFRRELQERIAGGVTCLTVDLNGVDLIDSSGLAAFICCHQTLKGRDGTLTIRGANEDLRGLFHLLKLDQHFDVCE